MKVGVIGAGAWGKNIIRNLAELDALAAIAETDRARQQACREDFPDAAVCSVDDLLDSDVDGVAIATPTPTHHDLAMQALRAGKDVFIEKPMTPDSATARALVELAEREKRVLMVGHLLLYQPAITWIRKFMASGELGELFGIRHERLTLGRARSVENVLWDIGVHDIAVLLYLVGQAPEHIRASGHRMLKLGVEDEVHVHFEFANGVRGNLHSSWLWPETTRQTIVRGARGMLVYDEVDQTVTLHRKWIDADLQNHDEGSEVVHRGHGQPLRLEMQHFLDRMADRETPLSSGESAVAVIETLERVTRALAR
jgi:predicted dehydrogenase